MGKNAVELSQIIERLSGRFPEFSAILAVTLAAIRGTAQISAGGPEEQIKQALAEGYNSYADLKERTGLKPSLIHYHCYKLAEAGIIEIKSTSNIKDDYPAGGRPRVLFFLKFKV